LGFVGFCWVIFGFDGYTLVTAVSLALPAHFTYESSIQRYKIICELRFERSINAGAEPPRLRDRLQRVVEYENPPLLLVAIKNYGCQICQLA
jgi:hypothetical protein